MEKVESDPLENDLTDPYGIVRSEKLDEVDRTARAYGWEIGAGQNLGRVIELSPNNPFIDPDWRNKLTKEASNDD